MSLEENLALNTEALNKLAETNERLISIMSLKAKEEVADTPTSPAPTAEKKKAPAKKAAPKKAPPKKAAPTKVVEQEVIEAEPEDDNTSLFDKGEVAEGVVEEVVEEEVKLGSAPETEGSEWFIYTTDLCNQLSAKTGDPAGTQAICQKHGVKDLSKADEVTLSKIGLEIETLDGTGG